MSFLLDTNVLSEMRKPQPDANVFAWLDAAEEERTFLSVVSIAEIQRGLALMAASRQRTVLDHWFREDLLKRFDGRIIDINPAVALAWGNLSAQARLKGFGLEAMDAFLAATAQAHRLCLVTRNVKDFTAFDIDVLNPWIKQA